MATKKQVTSKQVANMTDEAPVDPRALMISNNEEDYDSGFGDGQDIVIPKLLLMQGQSQMVLSGEAAFGEIRQSITKEKLADQNNPVFILPFYMSKHWVVSRKENERWVFDRYEAYSPLKRYNYTEIIDGVQLKFEESLNFYCFLRDVELPCVVSFKSTSRRAGQNIYTQCYVINKAQGKLPFSTWFALKATKEQKQGNTYCKFEVKVAPSEAITSDELEKCKQWFKMLKSNADQFQVDNSEHDSSDFSDDNNVSF